MYIKEIFVFAVFFLITRFFWAKRRFFYLASKIPRSNYDFSWKGIRETLSADNKKIFHHIYNSVKDCDGIVKTWLGPVLFVILNHPEDIKIVWNSKDCYDKPYFVKFPGIYKGSLFGEIEYWHSHRKILDPFFGSQKMKNFLDIFNKSSKVLTDKIESKAGGSEFDIFHYMTALTLETILGAMELDVDIQNLEEKSRDSTIKGLEHASRLIAKRMFSFWLHPEFIYNRTRYFVEETKAKASAFIYADDVVANIRKLKEGSNEFEEKPTTFMRALTNNKHKLTNSEIVDEIKTILIAAQDTSALTMSSTLLLLAMHKNIQDKVAVELKQVLGDLNEVAHISLEHLNRLEFLEMVVNEALRLMPVVPFVLRKSSREIPVTKNFIIPAASNILVPIFAVHRNKKIWGDDANQFRPERFEKGSFQKIHPYAFIPFTKGPRMCLGYRYAMTLIKVQLAHFLMKYEVDTLLKYEEIEFELNVTLIVCQGYKIKITKRSD